MDEQTPNWGITPVPERLRVLGTFDITLLWGSLGVSLLVVVAGAMLVPALTLGQAFLAILVGALIGNAMLGAGGLIGADARVPAMVVLRAPLGRAGSYLATVLNVGQCLGWAVFELIIIATAAGALSERVFGFEARWAWTLVFGAVTLALALVGPIGVVRRFLRRFAIWIVLVSLVYLTWWALDGADFGRMWNTPSDKSLTLWGGIDLVVALTVTWIPLAPDYTRFARTRASAFVGTAVGYFIPTLWMWSLGAVILLSRMLDDPAELPAAVVAAGFGSALALLALTVDEVDEAFANAYSAAVSAQNVLTQVPQRVLIVLSCALATAGALVLDLGSYADFLFLLGSFFVPLFGVLLADWLVAGARYREGDVFGAPPVRAGAIGAWLAGFVLYQWLFPQGPRWWIELVQQARPSDLLRTLEIGASLPSFALAFSLGAAASYFGRRERPASGPA